MPATQLVTNYDIAQIFLGDNLYDSGTYTNATGSPVVIVQGTLLGRIESSAAIAPAVSTVTDGSEYPIGIYADGTVTVAPAASVLMCYCVKGRVNQNKIVFQNGTDILTTPVGTAATGGGIIKDVLVRNSGIFLIPSIEITIADPNQ